MTRILAAIVIIGLLALPLSADSPQPVQNNFVTTVVSMKATPGGLYGFVIGNTTAAACFLQVFNATTANVTLGSTVPTMSLQVPANGTLALAFENSPVNFNTAISIAATTGAGNSTTCGMVVTFLIL